MAVRVEKKVRAMERHRRVAQQFQEWLEGHPNATITRKVKTFDAISDAEWLEGHLKVKGENVTT